MKGKKTGGRQKGSLNKNKSAADRLAELGCDGIEGMTMIAQNKLPCGVCRGEGKTRYQLAKDQIRPCVICRDAYPRPDCVWCSGTGLQSIGVRTCLSCYGTLWEACSPDLRGKMYAELTKYEFAQKKAVEISGAVDFNEITRRLEAGRLRMKKAEEEKP
jgi:hypothetical protein